MRDYLKYWRVTRQFIKKKYNISVPDMELLLYLQSERYFTASDIAKGGNIMTFDPKRVKKLVEAGWISLFRERRGKAADVYQLTLKAHSMIKSIYDKLDGDSFPTSAKANPLFKKNARYSDKVYRNFILDINKAIKQRQHPFQ